MEQKQIKHPYWLMVGISILLSFLAMLLFFPALSPIYPAYSYDATSIDTNFFFYVGKRMGEGAKPYIDIFDQKGILTFLLFYLGTKLGGRNGVFLIHVILNFGVFFTTLIAVYQLRGSMKDILTASCVLLLLETITGFGSTVSYQSAWLGGIAIDLYLFGIAKDKDRYFLLGSFAAGAQIGLAFNSRPSDGFVCFAMFAFYFVYWLRHRKNLQLLWNALLAILGFALVIGFFFGYCYLNGYMLEMIRVEYIGGFFYSHELSSRDKGIMCLLITLYMLIIALFYRETQAKGFMKEYGLFVLIVSLLSSLLQLLVAKYIHYFQSTLVLLTFSITFCFLSLKSKEKKPELHTPLKASLGSLGILIGMAYLSLYYVIPNPDFSKDVNHEIKNEIRETIPEIDTLGENEIYLIDVNASLLNEFDIDSTCPYQTYQKNYIAFNPEVTDEIIDFLKETQPKYILLDDLHGSVDNNEEGNEGVDRIMDYCLQDERYVEITSDSLQEVYETFHIYQNQESREL